MRACFAAHDGRRRCIRRTDRWPGQPMRWPPCTIGGSCGATACRPVRPSGSRVRVGGQRCRIAEHSGSISRWTRCDAVAASAVSAGLGVKSVGRRCASRCTRGARRESSGAQRLAAQCVGWTRWPVAVAMRYDRLAALRGLKRPSSLVVYISKTPRMPKCSHACVMRASCDE
jgi:hypothetical protein